MSANLFARLSLAFGRRLGLERRPRITVLFPRVSTGTCRKQLRLEIARNNQNQSRLETSVWWRCLLAESSCVLSTFLRLEPLARRSPAVCDGARLRRCTTGTGTDPVELLKLLAVNACAQCFLGCVQHFLHQNTGASRLPIQPFYCILQDIQKNNET